MTTVDSRPASRWREDLRTWAFVTHRDTALAIAAGLLVAGAGLVKAAQKIGEKV